MTRLYVCDTVFHNFLLIAYYKVLSKNSKEILI